MFTNNFIQKISGQAKLKNDFALVLLAQIKIEDDELENAEVILKSLDRSDNQTHWYYWVQSNLSFAKKEYPNAEKMAFEVLRLNSLFYGAYDLLHKIYEQTGEKEKLIDLAKKVRAHFPGYPKMDHIESLLAANAPGETEPVEAMPETEIVDSTPEKEENQLDQIIAGVASGEIADSFDDKETEEFSSAMKDVFADKPAGTEPTIAELGEKLPDELQTEPVGIEKIKTDHKSEIDIDDLVASAERLSDSLGAAPKTGAKSEMVKKTKQEHVIVSRTLGEIYAAQGQIEEAIVVFSSLLKTNPEDETLKRKLHHLKSLRKS